MMRNRHLSLFSAICLVSICFTPLIWPTTAFSLSYDYAVEGADGSLVQAGQEAFGTLGGDRLTSDSVNLKASIDFRHMNIPAPRLLLRFLFLPSMGLC